MKREYIVVSVGGSLIAPDDLDTDFLHRFRECIRKKIGQGFSFFIITGGGKTARRYQDAARTVRGDLSREDLDWLGIHATRLNAHLLRALFREEAHRAIIKNPTRAIFPHTPVIIGAGWKPGWSTDYCAVLAAKRLGAKRIVNLSNIDHVYAEDPRINPNAAPLTSISWKAFRELIPKEWDPGLSSPFDPIAAREAQKAHIEVAIVNGAKLEEFERYLTGESFAGTIIS